MFTGIINKISKINNIINKGSYIKLIIQSPFLSDELKMGDSVSVNGVCLTITESNGEVISFDVQTETLNKTYFRELRIGDIVNLELAMTLNGRLGGHIVQGHVDEVGFLENNEKSSDDWILSIRASESFLNHIVRKGSVTVDGISLTIVDITDRYFTSHIVPHTLENTNLKYKRKNDKVNLEADIIGKYVYNYLSRVKNTDNQSLFNKLMEGGFI